MEFLHKIPSINDMISYTLVSLINHDGNSLDYGNYAFNVFDASTGIWWHCDDENITEIGALPKGFYITENHKKSKKSDVWINTFTIFVLYQNKPFEKIQLIFFQ